MWKERRLGLLLKALFSPLCRFAQCYLGLLSGLLRGDKSLCYCHIYFRWLNPHRSLAAEKQQQQQQQQPWRQFKDLRQETDNDSGLSSLYHIYLHTLLKSWHGAVPHYSLRLSFLASWWTFQRQEVQKVIFFHHKSIPLYLLPAPHSPSSPFWTSTFGCRVYPFLQRTNVHPNTWVNVSFCVCIFHVVVFLLQIMLHDKTMPIALTCYAMTVEDVMLNHLPFITRTWRAVPFPGGRFQPLLLVTRCQGPSANG